MKRYVIPCHEGTPSGPAPKLLSEQGIGRILQRKILCWSPNIGSYGMGGPGFWGFKLGTTGGHLQEWLILTVWNAGDCLLFDGKRGEIFAADFMAEHPGADMEAFRQHHLTRVNEITEKIIGSKIMRAHITPTSSKILFQRGYETHRLEIPNDSSGRLQSRGWQPEESQLDAWVLSEKNEIWA
jgi:hypothetical protein